MNRSIDPEIHGSDLRISCLADFVELEAFKGNASRTEAEIADYIGDCGWERLLEPRYEGAGIDPYVRHADAQDNNRERASAVLTLIEQRRAILGEAYPFEFGPGRRVERQREAKVYLWYLFVSLVHGLNLPDVPLPSEEFEKVVAIGLQHAGLPSVTVGTAAGAGNFEVKVRSMAEQFRGLVATIDEALVSRSQNDGGIDTFGMFRCGIDNRHAQWVFIGQSTVGKSESWLKKIHEPNPVFWEDVFGGRVIPIPFFATPHHIPDDFLLYLTRHKRCLIDRIRLTNWTSNPPNSFDDYEEIVRQLVLD
jgi:hypothetical protein